MQLKNRARTRFYWKGVLYALMLLSVMFGTTFIQDAKAQQMATVHVLIEEATGGGCTDWFDPPDIYWDVYVDGQKQTSVGTPITPIIAPFIVDKEFDFDVDMSKGTVPIVIEQWDDEWPTANEQCDIDPGDGRALNFDLDLVTCAISGADASGSCNTSIYSGTSGQFKFKVSVDYPPLVSGLSIRCLHDPIWPKSGEWVTITAEALDENANLIPVNIEELEIWVDNQSAPQVTTTAQSYSYRHYVPQSGTSEILYRCRAKNSGLWASSGWRIVQVGQPAEGRAVPILYTGVSDSRVDITFIADVNSYSGPDDPDFLADIHNIIRDSYYAKDTTIRSGGRTFLFKQNAINFWIALDTGEAFDWSASNDHVIPENWDTEYSFVDSGALVHTNSLRDYAQHSRRIFSAQTSSLDNFLHEAGHSPFGLADEYCCDGGYFAAQPNPNIYSSQGDCQNDALANGVGDACQQIQNTAGTTVNWYRVEPATTLGNDLMQDMGDHTVRPADDRQINWYFGLCRHGGC
ncbi:MAG: hypothetical protein A4E65_03170 [Syntrophorhabdus sp. PtaU1.Bin153]|nr:MAG: hypothetical protein A4E65_03170 [Syntrophorhabdus sp. PtaU1.Bin153]